MRHESLFLTTSLCFAAVVSVKTQMPRCYSSKCKPTRQEGIALLRLQMLTGYCMPSQLLMYLAETRPDLDVDDLAGLPPHTVKIHVCLHIVIIADRSSC